MKKSLQFFFICLFVLFTFLSGKLSAYNPTHKARTKLLKSPKAHKVRRKVTGIHYLRSLNQSLYTCPNPPSPLPPNDGLILGCALNETISIISNTTFPGPGQPCYFHCGLRWDGPANWLFTVGPDGAGSRSGYSPFYGDLGTPNDPMSIQVPSSGISNGFISTVTLTAIYTDCDAPNNTSSSANLWFGPPAVNNGKVNSNAYSGGTVYVPSGYANLNVQIDGGGPTSSTKWYITNGSGTLNPSYNYCSISFSNFVRVVVETTNRCGNGGSYTFYLSNQQGYYGYKVGPNPANDQLSIFMEMKEMAGELIESVDLYNDKSKLVASVGSDKLKTGSYDKNTIDLNVKSLPRGTYFLNVKMKDHIESHQVVLN